MSFASPQSFQSKRSRVNSATMATQDVEKNREEEADKELAEYQACLSKPEVAEPPPKKARTTQVLDIKRLCFKDLSLNKGATAEFAMLDEASSAWVLNLTPTKEVWSETTHGFPITKYGNKELEIITGNPKDEKDKFVKMDFALTAEALDKLEALEDAMQKKSQFRGKPIGGNFKDGTIRARVYIDDSKRDCSKFQLVVPDGKAKKVVSGAGWPFLKDYAYAHNLFRGCKVKLVLRAPWNWSNDKSGSWGTAWAVEQIAIDATTARASGVQAAEPQFDAEDLM